MRSARYAALSITLLAAFSLAWATPAASGEIGSGKATRVGDVPPVGSNGDAIVGISARFAPAADIDLSALSLTISSLLNESDAGGAGELVEGTEGAALVPLTLAPRAGARATSAIFTTPGSVRPSVRVSVRRRSDGTYQMSLKVNRATIPVGPALCAGDPMTTTLTTEISFGDGVNPPVFGEAFSTAWICGTGRLRVAPPAPKPTPVPGAPIARLKVNQVTRQTGEPNLVELDGSASSDPDGTVDSYSFSVLDVASQTVVFGPSTGATDTVETTLPPGDYRGSLTVTDNDGKVSTATRGFRLH
jgi:K319L-like, PKD domain